MEASSSERVRERAGGAAPATSAAPSQPSVLPTVIGILIAGIAVLAVGFWIDAVRQRGAAEAAAIPQIQLIEPAPGASVASPVPVVFEVPVRLRWIAGGWQTGRLHLHASVNGRELMPGARDLEPMGQNRYRWTLPPLPSGEHTLRLFWSGPDHRPIDEGASTPIYVQVQ